MLLPPLDDHFVCTHNATTGVLSAAALLRARARDYSANDGDPARSET